LRAARNLLFPLAGVGANVGEERLGMRYIVAWMLGVPFSVIVIWYVVGHAACGR
jgi:hypothetical protein